MNTRLLCLALSFLPLSAFAQGSLTPPPGTPAPTMKTLAQLDAKLEPRTAINLTNTPGDANSIYKITQSGSYYLTANVTGIDFKHGILVVADNVTIDLCGFNLIGAQFSRDAIHSDGGPSLTGLVVRNGTITRWGNGSSGVFAGSVAQIHIEDLTISEGSAEGVWIGAQGKIQHCNVTGGRNGLRAGAGSIIADCTVKNTSEHGIDAGSNCTLRNCSVANAGQTGINALSNSTIQGCEVSDSAGGINVVTSTVINCVASNNTTAGILAADGSSLQGCIVYFNNTNGITAQTGCTVRACNVRGNKQNGIESGSGGQIADNLCSDNGLAAGIQSNILITGDSCRVEGNSILGGDRGITTNGGGNVIVRNSVRGGTDRYGGIAGGNDVGPIGTAAASTSPWANISY